MMTKRCNVRGNRPSGTKVATLLFLLLVPGIVKDALGEPQTLKRIRVKKAPSSRSELNLKEIPYKILFETRRKTAGRENWELFQIDADGSNPINITCDYISNPSCLSSVSCRYDLLYQIRYG